MDPETESSWRILESDKERDGIQNWDLQSGVMGDKMHVCEWANKWCSLYKSDRSCQKHMLYLCLCCVPWGFAVPEIFWDAFFKGVMMNSDDSHNKIAEKHIWNKSFLFFPYQIKLLFKT